jgi:hypothetical protein
MLPRRRAYLDISNDIVDENDGGEELSKAVFASVCKLEEEGHYCRAKALLHECSRDKPVMRNQAGVQQQVFTLLEAWINIFSDGMLLQATELCAKLEAQVEELLQQSTVNGAKVRFSNYLRSLSLNNP